MSGRLLPPGRYGYDALCDGDRIETASAAITSEMIDSFAALTGDRFVIHMSEDAARAAGFGGRVAHGLLVLSVVDGLKNQTAAQFHSVVSLGWDWRFVAPVLAGDSIRARLIIASRRLSSDGQRGILGIDFEVLNQRDEVVQSGGNALMVWR